MDGRGYRLKGDRTWVKKVASQAKMGVTAATASRPRPIRRSTVRR